MSSAFDKLNLKSQRQIVVLNAPDSFKKELTTLRNVSILRELQNLDEIEFSLAFVTKQKEVETLAKIIASKVKGDAVVWFAYPKGTSRKYESEINRDNGWQILGKLGFEGVRGVSIDDDWSAPPLSAGGIYQGDEPRPEACDERAGQSTPRKEIIVVRVTQAMSFANYELLTMRSR